MREKPTRALEDFRARSVAGTVYPEASGKVVLDRIRAHHCLHNNG
jgi:hypothetical protein